MTRFEIAFNHDGFGILGDLARTAMTDAHAAALLVDPLARVGVSVVEWAVGSTGVHNCRTRHGRLITRALLEQTHGDHPRMWGKDAPKYLPVGDAVEHYAHGAKDLLDIVVRRGQAAGLTVLASLRLNHSLGRWMDGVPGSGFLDGLRRDFRDPAFRDYLLEVLADLLDKGVDGVGLDFERKAPFFPDDAPQAERFAACRQFLRDARRLTDRTLLARVSHDSATGVPQGQQPLEWIREGLLDVVVPATHNHEGDDLSWSVDAFLSAAADSARPCRVWPQIWPTPGGWNRGHPVRHAPAAVVDRVRRVRKAGADGAYFFNFCCFWPRRETLDGGDAGMFRAAATAAEDSRDHHGRAPDDPS